MSEGLEQVDDRTLAAIAAGLRTGRLAPPFTALQFGQYASPAVAAGVAAAAMRFVEHGGDGKTFAAALELILEDRRRRGDSTGAVDLVTSGPEAPGVANRDTAVVVRELFAHAKKSVLVVGYAVYQGASVFEALPDRMEEIPDLDVRLFLNIARPDNDTSNDEIIVSRYAQRFRDSQWPKDCRLPEVYYDPRSVSDDKRSSLHAKCVVVDAEQVFVSSANFTKAGQERNIEVGLKIESPWLAGRLIRHFQLLHEHGLAVRAF